MQLQKLYSKLGKAWATNVERSKVVQKTTRISKASAAMEELEHNNLLTSGIKRWRCLRDKLPQIVELHNAAPGKNQSECTEMATANESTINGIQEEMRATQIKRSDTESRMREWRRSCWSV